MQFNVSNCTDRRGVFSPALVAKVIREGADIVAVQEIERTKANPRGGSSTRAFDQVSELAQSTGMHAYFVPKATYDGGEVGCAVLSKFPAKAMLTLRYKSWKVHGSTRWGGPGPQAAVAVSVRPPGFQTDIWVISTQLGGDASGQVQLAEMSELTHWIPAFCGHYTLPNGMPTITAKQATAGPIGDIMVAVAGFRNDVAMQRQQLTRDQDRLPLITASNSDLMNVKD
ncbi:unnamed protein product [Symbiodinium sp. KB8]|nr:unnamed protein product [Symbiodinium sp. KB8]